MAQTLRILWKGLRWNQPLNVNWGAISADSVVHISVSEAKRIYGMYFGAPIIERFMGSAQIEVRNVSPREGGVNFFVYVDWDEPLDITTDITVLDPPFHVIDASNGQIWSLSTKSLGQKAHQFLTKSLSEAQLKKLQELTLKESLVSSKITASVLSLPGKGRKASRRKK